MTRTRIPLPRRAIEDQELHMIITPIQRLERALRMSIDEAINLPLVAAALVEGADVLVAYEAWGKPVEEVHGAGFCLVDFFHELLGEGVAEVVVASVVVVYGGSVGSVPECRAGVGDRRDAHVAWYASRGHLGGGGVVGVVVGLVYTLKLYVCWRVVSVGGGGDRVLDVLSYSTAVTQKRG